MESAYGLEIRYAMKANSSAAVLKILKLKGAKIDASSLNEALRAQKVGYALSDITYTTQEITERKDRETLFNMILSGMKFNVSSRLQYRMVR
jgi:diaminopimelate decarboxylase